MRDVEFKRQRLAFLEGVIEGIRLYAIWQNGVQLVGCQQKPLKEVLTPYQEEIHRILRDLGSQEAPEAPKP